MEIIVQKIVDGPLHLNKIETEENTTVQDYSTRCKCTNKSRNTIEKTMDAFLNG